MCVRDTWDNIKCTYIQIIGVPEEEKKKEYEKILKILVKNSIHRSTGLIDPLSGPFHGL